MLKIEEKSFNKKHYERVNIRYLNNGNPFFYLGSISLNLPENVIIEPNNERSIIFDLKRISEEDNYILKLVKVSDEEAVSLEIGVHFRIGKRNENIRYNDPTKLLRSCYFNPCLTISKSEIGKYSDLYSKYVYHKYNKGQTDDILDLKSLANIKCVNSFNEIFKKLYPLEFEQKFYNEHGNLIRFYLGVPGVGEYFGYAGNISCIVPKVDHKDDSKYFDTMEGLIVYQLLFKIISVTDAIEVTSGVVFHFKSLLSTNVSFDYEYKNSPLCYIKPTEEYKEIYGKSISNFDLFSKWISELLIEAKKTYDRKMDECENSHRSSLNDAFDIARVDNAIYDLEKNNVVKESDVHKLIKEISSRTTDFD